MERRLAKREIYKRGCEYCKIVRHEGYKWICPHDECPYHVLDKYEHYEHYLISEDAIGEAAELEQGKALNQVLDPGGAYFRKRAWDLKKAEKSAKKPQE